MNTVNVHSLLSTRSTQNAMAALKKANPEADYELAQSFMAEGRIENAYFWYLKASSAGLGKAKNALEGLYQRGEIRTINLNTMVALLQKSSEQGLTSSQRELALCYFNGCGVKEDKEWAHFWFLKAAKKGDVVSQYYLGEMFKDGIGCKIDLDQSFIWYLKAASKGYMKAQVALGQIYFDGLGVAPSVANALPWFKKAAQQGSEEALNFLLLIKFGEKYKEAPMNFYTDYLVSLNQMSRYVAKH